MYAFERAQKPHAMRASVLSRWLAIYWGWLDSWMLLRSYLAVETRQQAPCKKKTHRENAPAPCFVKDSDGVVRNKIMSSSQDSCQCMVYQTKTRSQTGHQFGFA